MAVLHDCITRSLATRRPMEAAARQRTQAAAQVQLLPNGLGRGWLWLRSKHGWTHRYCRVVVQRSRAYTPYRLQWFKDEPADRLADHIDCELCGEVLW